MRKRRAMRHTRRRTSKQPLSTTPRHKNLNRTTSFISTTRQVSYWVVCSIEEEKEKEEEDNKDDDSDVNDINDYDNNNNNNNNSKDDKFLSSGALRGGRLQQVHRRVSEGC